MAKALKEPLQAVVDFVEPRAPVWQERLGLGHIDIEHAYLDSFYEDASGDDFVVTATTEGRWNYYQAKVKWYLLAAVRHETRTVEKILLHELCHVLLMSEQDLLDYKLSQANTVEAMNEESFHTLQGMYYERMEMSTEACTKTLWKAWGPVKPSELATVA